MKESPKSNENTAKFKIQLYKNAYDFYLEFIKETKQSAEKHAFFLDKAILTISTAGIGILLTFQNNFEAFETNRWQLILMILSFISLTLAITGVLISFYSIQRVFLKNSKAIEPWYQEAIKLIDGIDENKGIEEQKDVITKAGIEPKFNIFWLEVTKICNTMASLFVWFGILTGVGFFLVQILSHRNFTHPQTLTEISNPTKTK